MKKKIIIAVLALALAGCGSSSSSTPAGIKKMAASGASEKDMLSEVEKGSNYTLTADDIIDLNKAGVPKNVVIAMIQKHPPITQQSAANSPVSDSKSK